MTTIKDIAKARRCDPFNGILVLNHAGGYNDKTKTKIEQIAASLHYQKMKPHQT